MTLRLVKAMAWLQWRLLVNGLRGGRHRGSLETFSRWSEVVVPVLATVVLIPMTAVMAIGGGFAGWELARSPEHRAVVAFVLAIGFLVPLLWFLLRPLAFAGQSGFERGELLRLLPIPRSFLRRLELFRAVLDPIFLVFAAAALALPLGTLAAGRPLVTLVAIAGGVVLLAFFACFSAVLTLGMQVLLRDRRRGEAATLVIFLVLSTAGVVPQFFARDRHAAPAPAAARAARDPRAPGRRPRPVDAVRELEIPVALRVLPSGLYALGLADGSAGRGAGAALELGALAALAALAYAGTATLHRRLLDTPETSGGRVSHAAAIVRTARWPGLSPVVSATAAAYVHTVLRTVRGKMLLIGPAFTTVLFALVFTHGVSPAGVMKQPLAIAALAVFIGLANLASVTCNQFAVDGSALVLEFLQPLGDRDLLLGKLAGATALFAVSLTVALLPLPVLFPGVSPALLLAVLFGGLAAHFVLAPVNALLSVLFPKSVDLGKLGSAGKPHSTAALVSFLAQGFALLPSAGCIAVAWLVLENLALAPVLTGAWMIAAWFLAVAALRLVARAVFARRENLVMVTMGR
jgi:hypothetical protein